MVENNNFSFATYDSLFGVTGTGNLFKPGTLTGKSPTFVRKGAKADKTTGIYSRVLVLPIAQTGEGFLHKLVGESGQTVIRGGFSMASVREGTNGSWRLPEPILGQRSRPLVPLRWAAQNNIPVGMLFRSGLLAHMTTYLRA